MDCKVVLLGQENAGKISLSNRNVSPGFAEFSCATISALACAYINDRIYQI